VDPVQDQRQRANARGVPVAPLRGVVQEHDRPTAQASVHPRTTAVDTGSDAVPERTLKRTMGARARFAPAAVARAHDPNGGPEQVAAGPRRRAPRRRAHGSMSAAMARESTGRGAKRAGIREPPVWCPAGDDLPHHVRMPVHALSHQEEGGAIAIRQGSPGWRECSRMRSVIGRLAPPHEPPDPRAPCVAEHLESSERRVPTASSRRRRP
jgi:hypothetical protein